MENIEIKNIELLDEKEKSLAEKLFPEYHEKIKRQIKNKDTTLKIDIKEHGKGGKRKKYSITVTLEFARNIIKANAFDWEFARTIHKVMEKLITEIEHKFHVSEQR